MGLAAIFAGILLAILFWFSFLSYMAQSPLWMSLGSPRIQNEPSAPLINPKYLAGDDTDIPVACLHTENSTWPRIGWSLLIGMAWSAGFFLISGYLDERYRLEPLGSKEAGQALREGFLFSTASLVAAALIVNMTRRAIRRHRAHE